MSKWTEKDVLEHAEKLKSPFDRQPEQQPGFMGMAGRATQSIKELLKRKPNGGQVQ